MNITFLLNKVPIIPINSFHPSASAKRKWWSQWERTSLMHVLNVQLSGTSTLLCADTHQWWVCKQKAHHLFTFCCRGWGVGWGGGADENGWQKEINGVKNSRCRWKQNKSHLGWEWFFWSCDCDPKSLSRRFKMHPHICLPSWKSVKKKKCVREKLMEEEEEGWGEAVAAGLLGPIEGIVICNIHSNVPYQM